MDRNYVKIGDEHPTVSSNSLIISLIKYIQVYKSDAYLF